MALATLTTKGQVTIPKAIRDALKLHSGDKIEIVITKEGEATMRPVSKTVDDMFCKLYQPDRKVVTIEEMNAAIRARMQNKVQ